ncbi:MAG: phosphoribosylformylglycinamidine synthase [Oscillospiraceae bacterium]|nr:phosphoribosylformylglycinamidine synthase [Oscillospiraceae bacterium]
MKRILVEKKEPFRLEERDMMLEIRDALNIPRVTGVRIFNGYDIEGQEKTEGQVHCLVFAQDSVPVPLSSIFSEAGRDIVYEDVPDTTGAACVFAVAAAIDQYDQREDYANQLLRIVESNSEPNVRVFKVIAFYGDLSSSDIDKIKSYYINPLETREIPLTATKPRVYTDAETVEVIKGFSNADDDLLKMLAGKYGIAMAIDNLKLCREYFAKEQKDPTVTEMKVLDTYWSDHCRHSTFMTVIDEVTINENKYTEGLKRAQELYEHAKTYVYGDTDRPLCLMDIATMSMKKLKKCGELDDMEKSDEVNACSIEVTVPVDGKPTDMIVMFKNETHNHPTEMEPFGGASTCLGGAIRDPLSGRAHAFGAIRLTGSGDPREPVEDTLPGKLPQRKITQTAADGYSSYGNGIGLALGQLIEVYDPGFKAKRMECGAIVAAAKKAEIFRGKPHPGDVVVLVGGNTGRDGCGGATGSSKEHDDESLEKGGAEVQKGNPVIERNIVRLFRKPFVSKMIKTCNDFGAGGVCVAVGELADGLKIDLDKVPVKYPGLDGTELAISESQERMAVVLDAVNLELFLAEAKKENLNAVKIADVTDTGRVLMTWRGDVILDMSSDFLNSGGVRQSTRVVVAAPCIVNHPSSVDDTLFSKRANDLKQTWLSNLSDLNVCSKKGIANRFDFTAGGGTVFSPYGGVYQKTPEQGLAMRLPLLEGETDFGTLMTVGHNPSLGYSSPFHAAMYAVIESVMKITAMGGDYRKVRLSFQEYFERLATGESWGKPYAALMGAFLAQDELGIPAIGGKDSMSGTFNDINVPPSLISFAVTIADTTKLISRAFKSSGHNVYLLKTPVDDGGMPNFKVLRQNMSSVLTLTEYGCVRAASVVGTGGIAATISEMAFGNRIGFAFESDFKDDLFAPQYTTMILELDVVPKDHKGLRDEFILLGKTTDKKSIEIDGVAIPLSEAEQAWEGALDNVFPSINSPPVITRSSYPVNTNTSPSAIIKTSSPVSSDTSPASQNQTATPNPSSLKEPLVPAAQTNKQPKVLIPIFPGSTGEYELEKQFRIACAEVNTVLFRTLTSSDIEDSYSELTEAVNNANILAIPSGMSAGAEPDGSSKLIALILRHPNVKEAVNKLISERKGLVLGTGEGFKALLKTGLIQTGQIQDVENGDILLTKHPSNNYYCTLRTVMIEENTTSPWLKNMAGELETVPISGKDIVVHMSEELYKEYMVKGQITSQYISEQGDDSSVSINDGIGNKKCNSSHTIEAMTSENGLVLGRAGLVENFTKGLYTNVFDAKESRIFSNAVSYITQMQL